MSSAPSIFTKVLKPIYSYFRIIGIICSYYLDDTFILGRTFQETLKHTEIVFDTLIALGFVPKIPKCSLIPSTRIRHLGFYIDSIKMTVELPQDKIDTTVDLATESYHSTSPVAIRLLSKFIGYLVSSFPAVELGPLFYRSLEKYKIQGLKQNNFSYDAKAILSDQSKKICYGGLNVYTSIALNQSNLEPHLLFYFLMHLMKDLGHT